MRQRESVWASIFLLCFGVGVLAFLTAIDRQQWFHIKPATGTAVALSKAAAEPGTRASAD